MKKTEWDERSKARTNEKEALKAGKMILAKVFDVVESSGLRRQRVHFGGSVWNATGEPVQVSPALRAWEGAYFFRREIYLFSCLSASGEHIGPEV